MNTNKWFFGVIILIVIFSLLVGINIKDSKWLNTSIAGAEAHTIEATTNNQVARNNIDIQVYQAQSDLKLQEVNHQYELNEIVFQNEKQQIQRQPEIDAQMQGLALEAQTALNNQALAARERHSQLLDNLLLWSVSAGIIIVSLLVSVIVFKIVYNTLKTSKASPSSNPTTSIWNSPDYRRMVRQQARYSELMARHLSGVAAESTGWDGFAVYAGQQGTSIGASE